MCICIENGLFPQFFETYYITVFTVGGKRCDIKYMNVSILNNFWYSI